MGGAVLPLPNTPSWHGAQGEHRDNFTFLPFTPSGNVWIRPHINVRCTGRVEVCLTPMI
jgi:hypothetical protein